uniref:anti-sigma factor n=1 Tax=Neorhizobium sp. EC2-8 TaxID=3129230 RepID=UPI00310109B7
MTTGEHGHGKRSQDEILAGEYVLGLLSLDARRRVENRIRSDRAFALLVKGWESDLSSFNDDYEDVAPGAAVFTEIERRLFGPSKSASSAGRLWNSVGFWRGLSLGTSLVAVAALVFSFMVPPISPRTNQLVAELSTPNNAVNMLAAYDATSGRMRIVPVAAGRPDERSLELWLVPSSGSPLSLGVFPPGMDGELVIPSDRRAPIDEGTTFAVTLEPFGGSPTGAATGPIVASGTLRRQ